MQRLVFSIVAVYCLFLVAIQAQIINPPSVNCPYSYVGPSGAINWATICAGTYPSCAGDTQSPIDIIPHWAMNSTELGPIRMNYTDTRSTLTWDGYSLKIYPNNTNINFGNLSAIPQLSYLLPNASSYVFKYAMVHAVSEHTVYGIPYDAELHLYHEAQNGSQPSIVVLCYFYTIGSPSILLDGVVKSLAMMPNKTVTNSAPFTSVITMPWGTVLNNMSNGNNSYYHYNGSKTSPPCTTDYRHFVFSDPRSLSQSQFNTLMKVLNNNWRPLQPQNARQVWFYDGSVQHAHSSASSLNSFLWNLISYFY